MAQRYYKIVLVGTKAAGAWSASARLSEALETLGHTVFPFTPERWPGLFTGEGAFNAAGIAKFLEVQKPDALILADGVQAVGLEALAERGVACGVVAATPAQAQRSCDNGTASHVDFLLTMYADPTAAPAPEGFDGLALNLVPAPDNAYLATPLACDIAWGPCVTCLQDASPARLAYVRALAADTRLEGYALRCFGAGWPAPFACGTTCSNLPYAHRSAAACLVFPPEGEDARLAAADGLLSDEALALCEADGCKVVRIDADELASVANPQAGGEASPAALAGPNAQSVAQACARMRPQGGAFASRRFCAYDGAALDDALQAALEQIACDLAPRGLMQGCSHPRVMATMLGYFGRGNFGDEYVLTTIESRLRTCWPGASLIAVGEDPMHTLRARGIYCLTLADTHALNEALRRSTVALVAAGLLFDQGIRWTEGQAELLSAPRYSTIPGIGAFVELAHLNGIKTVFYGAGAGPLDVLDGRHLVRLMGSLGAEFLTRDKETADLILSCEVPAAQVQAKADVAFLGDAQPTQFCEDWLAREGIKLASTRLVALSMREYESCPADFAQRVAHALDGVAARHAEIKFAACVLDPSDAKLADQIRQAMAHAGRLHVYDPGEDIAPMADLLGRCSAGFSMRYHCTLLLAKGGAPCVGLGYLPKVVSLYADLGLDEYLLDMDADATQMEQALEGVVSLSDERVEELSTRVRELRKKAGESEEHLNALIAQGWDAKSCALPHEFFLREFPASAFSAKPASAAQLKAYDEVGRIRGEAARARAGQGNGVVPPAPPQPRKPDPNQVKIAQLTAELELVKDQLAHAKDDLAHHKDKLQATQGTLEATKGELAQRCSELAQTKADLGATQAKLACTQGSLSETEGILAHVKGDLNHARTTLAQVQGERASLRDENERLMDSVDMRVGTALCRAPRAIKRACRGSKDKNGD